MRHQRPVDQGLSGLDHVTRMDQKPLAVRDQVLAFDARFAADDNRPLAAPFFAEDFDGAVHFGDDRRVFGLAGLENFRDSRQTARDIGDARRLARGLGHHRAGRQERALGDLDMRPFGQVVHVQRLAVGVLEHDLRVQFAFVIDDHPADGAAGVLLHPHGLAFDHVLVADLAADLGQDRDAVRIPLAEDLAGLDLLVLFDHQFGAGGDFVLFQFPALGIQQRDFAVAGEHDLLAFFVPDRADADELDDTPAFGPRLALFDAGVDRTADMERTHRQLRARLADALRRDDADRHPLFDHRPGGQVHPVAQPADSQGGFAGHRAADLNLLQAQFLDPAADFRR